MVGCDVGRARRQGVAQRRPADVISDRWQASASSNGGETLVRATKQARAAAGRWRQPARRQRPIASLVRPGCIRANRRSTGDMSLTR